MRRTDPSFQFRTSSSGRADRIDARCCESLAGPERVINSSSPASSWIVTRTGLPKKNKKTGRWLLSIFFFFSNGPTNTLCPRSCVWKQLNCQSSNDSYTAEVIRWRNASHFSCSSILFFSVVICTNARSSVVLWILNSKWCKSKPSFWIGCR